MNFTESVRLVALRFTLILATIFLLNGCGNSSPENDLLTSGAPIVTTSANGNILTAERFVVAAGETSRFSENTTILASEDITIGGQVALDPGVSLTLFARNQINITGQIGPTPGVTARGTYDSLDGAIRTQGAPPSFVVLASPGHDVSGTIQGTEQQNIFIATFGENRSVTISGSVTAGPGVVGTRSTDGGSGADVEVGTVDADIAAASSLSGLGALAGDLSSNLPTLDDFERPNRINVSGIVRGGVGGKGFTDTTGTLGSLDTGSGSDPSFQATGRFREFRGGDGGPGGNTVLGAIILNLVDGDVRAGNGGDGGDCGTGNGTDGILEAGQSVLATTGSGGPGGKTTFVTTTPASLFRFSVRADGGTPGSSRVRAGNGGAGFDGGNTIINPGISGLQGTVDPPTSALGSTTTLRCQIVLENGGNGGTGSSQNPDGGDGGEVRINVPEALTSESPIDNSACTLDISIRNYANAGNGFDGCLAEPQLPGGNGGERGAELLLNGELSLAPSLAISRSFNDGDGGDGTSIGRGGDILGEINFPPLTRAEVIALDSDSFQRGDFGEPCPMIMVTVDLDPGTQGNQLERRFEFDSADTDPSCGTLQPLLIRNDISALGGDSITYTLTPRTPTGSGNGITLSSTTGTINPQFSTTITPTFVCADETTDFEHTFDLVITSRAGTLRESFVIVFRGTEVEPPPCVTQAVFRNNTVASTVDIRFQDDNMRVGTDVIVRFGQERTFTEDVALENLTIMYGSNGPRIGTDIDVPCGSRAVFTLNQDLTTSIVVEPIP